MLVGTTVFGAWILGPGTADAYRQYSQDKDATNCALCHGDFRASPYTSRVDGQPWSADLMEVHSTDMLDGDCDVCHGSGPRFPVLLGSSKGGAGLDPISCAGCHGRAEDGTGEGSEGYGAGLRQHHWNAGIQICTECHADANPASYMPVEEDFLPPYFSNSDPAHPNIPSDPCNPAADGHPEDYGASTLGLDNDGDDLYDEEDVVACPEPAPPVHVLGALGALMLIRRRRRR